MLQRWLLGSAFALLATMPAIAQVGPGGLTSAQVCTRDPNGSLSLRSGPGTGYGRITLVPNGSSLILNARQQAIDGFDWWNVSYNGSQGWVRSDYVCRSSGTRVSPAPRQVSSQNTGQVCTRSAEGRLSLRTGPGTAYGKLTEIPNGYTVVLVGGTQAPDGFYWWNVNFASMNGWVRSDYVCNLR